MNTKGINRCVVHIYKEYLFKIKYSSPLIRPPLVQFISILLSSVHLKSGLIRGVAFGGRCPIRRGLL